MKARLFGKLRPVLVVKPSSSRAEDPGFDSRLRREDFSRSSHTSDVSLTLQCLPCQVPGDTGSALGLVGPMSIYCHWVRWKVRFATPSSVWQHVELSERIPVHEIRLVCCWDVKQPTNSNINSSSGKQTGIGDIVRRKTWILNV